jgi:preprotein translocase subunit SecE
MSQDEENPKSTQNEEEQESSRALATAALESDGAPIVVPGEAADEGTAAQVGVEKYVHAAFFAAAFLMAFLGGKILLSVWNNLAEWPEAVRALPFLIEYTEEERSNWTLIIGAVLGVLAILRYYRRPTVRSWATDVASELARVTWPSKDTVTNGTIVVLVAGAIATIYIALLDRLWGYLTNLVYGA